MPATPLIIPFTDPGTKIFESLVNAINAYPTDQTMINLRATIDAHPDGIDYHTLLCLALIASVRTSVLGAGVFGQDLSIARDLAVGRNETIAGTLSVTLLATLLAGLTVTGLVTINNQILLKGDVVGQGVALGTYDETKYILQMKLSTDPSNPYQIFRALAPSPRTFDPSTQLTAGSTAIALIAGTGGGANQDIALTPAGTGSAVVNGTFKAKHITSNSGAAAIAAGPGAGTAPTVTLATGSNDIAGTINVTTGTTPTASAVIATLTFALAYLGTKIPTVVLFPANAATAAIMASSSINTTDALGNFAINGIAALAASTAYAFKYQVLQ